MYLRSFSTLDIGNSNDSWLCVISEDCLSNQPFLQVFFSDHEEFYSMRV